MYIYSSRRIYADNIVKQALNDLMSYSPTYSLLCSLQKYDLATFQHSLNVAYYVALIGLEMGYLEFQIRELAYTGILHDIGKLRIDHSIISKPGKLTKEEIEIVKRHPEYSLSLISNLDIRQPVKDGVAQHHEKINGRGYFIGLSGNKICFYARAVAVADAFDVITSKRSYKEASSAYTAFEKLQDANSFDQNIVNVFSNVMSIEGCALVG